MFMDHATCSMEVEDLEDLSEDSEADLETDEKFLLAAGEQSRSLRQRMKLWAEGTRSSRVEQLISELRLEKQEFKHDVEFKAEVDFTLFHKYQFRFRETRHQQDDYPLFVAGGSDSDTSTAEDGKDYTSSKSGNTLFGFKPKGAQLAPNHSVELVVSPAADVLLDVGESETEDQAGRVLFSLKRFGGESNSKVPRNLVYNESLMTEIFGSSLTADQVARFLGFVCLSPGFELQEDHRGWEKVHKKFDSHIAKVFLRS
ncbi:unnamed protein product [Amoebophrya sp. A25]|nr:unnamed protein product [Amoebophrya sp. A25]|eukprot:GSA25T00010042001.1